MKQDRLFILGLFLILSGTILLGFIHLAISTYIPNLSGWSDPPGKLHTILNNILGWFPYILSVVELLIGTILVVISLTNSKKGG
ncbi:hypothetical protein [Cytobacillus sp. IB215665]|uniref:hypothetical protein n=1 Tax=Cytobacillus sp. IB215665 TaxID=3097357 RepID=UPI002A0E2FC0|nr:hypothetical protein [Cytobacillus sp. IB215665]MDX8365656.1 hypothetical protein [Cytobacillus sp. IB215665]